MRGRRHFCAMLLLLLTTHVAAQVRTEKDDVVFVRTDTAGVFVGDVGEVIALDTTEIMLRRADRDVLYQRDAVQRIQLSPVKDDQLRRDWLVILTNSWHTNRRPLTPLRPDDDVVYVRGDTPGVYEARIGRITRLTANDVILRTHDGDQLYSRESVRRIDVGEVYVEGREGWYGVALKYWNAEIPPLVDLVRDVPFVGRPLVTINNLVPGVAPILAVLTLLVAFVAAVLKGYEIVVVSRDAQRLNKLRVQLEIAKLRQEALQLSTITKTRDAPILAKLDLPLPELAIAVASPVAKTPRSRVWNVLLSLAMRSHERTDQFAAYTAEAEIRSRRGRAALRREFYIRVAWLMLGILACVAYGIGFIGAAVTLLSAHPDFSDALFLTGGGLIGSALLRQATRMTLKIYDLRRAFSVTVAQPVNVDDAIAALPTA